MAGLLKAVFGGSKTTASPVPTADYADFADFASAPPPSPASIQPIASSSVIPQFAQTTGLPSVPYTKWYRVWERTSPSDFKQELFILPFVIALVLVHVWGTRTNRRKAKEWLSAHGPVLRQEFVVVGFGGLEAPSVEDVQSQGLAQSEELVVPEELLKEKGPNVYETYATGRLNVAFADFRLELVKRYNPLIHFGELALSLFFESMPAPQEKMQATSYAFDGKEKELVPVSGGKLGREVVEDRKLPGNSTYDGFVWAIVHKDAMKRLRDERYDLSLTSTKDHPKLPAWATVMSEGAEITETLLTPDLIKAVTEAGEALEALIVTDQPIDQPKKLNETVPKKRIHLNLHLPSSRSGYDSTLPLFQYFLRMPDHLVSAAHFRPEVMRRVRQTREDEIRKIKRVDEGEKAEERKSQGDKAKKEKRDALLSSMSADQQRKYLDKERDKEARRSQKKRTMRG